MTTQGRAAAKAMLLPPIFLVHSAAKLDRDLWRLELPVEAFMEFASGQARFIKYMFVEP